MSSAASSKDPPQRSELIDITYQQLHAALSGQAENLGPKHVTELLEPRIEQLKNLENPFGTPSDASRRQVESGTVKLADGVVLPVEAGDRPFVFAVSEQLNIDQVQAFILLRSFLYNEGLPDAAADVALADQIAELVEAIRPFYYAERLSLPRCLLPLFRALEDPSDPFHDTASRIVSRVQPDGAAFVHAALDQYIAKARAPLPTSIKDPATATRWAKQNLNEQIVLLEVLFWTLWSGVPCTGPLVVRVFETLYATEMGGAQSAAQFLLDREGMQLQEDGAALWMLISIEVLELERVGEPGGVEISAAPRDNDLYTADPVALAKLHKLVSQRTDVRYGCTFLAWTFVLTRCMEVVKEAKEVPGPYREFFASVRGSAREREDAHQAMLRTCLSPEANLFPLLLSLLTSSPLFVTSAYLKNGSVITDSNMVAYRSVFKGLIIALVELVPVESVPDFDTLVEIWVALFGRSEWHAVAGICRQFWDQDFHHGPARRAILDAARARFPVQPRPLMRLLRALSAAGMLNAETDATAAAPDENQAVCAQAVLAYFSQLLSYSQVIPAAMCTGPNALYEKSADRHGHGAVGLAYINLRPLGLPGGSVLPVKSLGRVLSSDDASEYVVVSWQHGHSGWTVLLEVLRDYVNRRRRAYGSTTAGRRLDSRRGGAQPVSLRLDDIGVESDPNGDEDTVIDALDLLRSVIQDNAALAEQLLDALEAGAGMSANEQGAPSDLVQLTTMVLEEALARTSQRRSNTSLPRAPLITAALSVFTALLALPRYAPRVWLYMRHSSALFALERNAGLVGAALAVERAAGEYTVLRAVLQLVERLFAEASAGVLVVLPGNAKLQQVKEDVLMRALRFVHTEVWVEHLGWKYARIGDRFDIGRCITTFYRQILRQAAPSAPDGPLTALSRAVVDILLVKATTSALNPLVSTIASGDALMKSLNGSRRYGDLRQLVSMLESHLQLVQLILNHKQNLSDPSQACLLEQLLCARTVARDITIADSSRPSLDPIDVLANYVKARALGSVISVAAMNVLSALCLSISALQPSPPTIVGRLSDPEATAAWLVRIVQHPYDDLSLRTAIWRFVAVAVDKEPAMAGLFLNGQFRIPADVKGKGKAAEQGSENKSISGKKGLSALRVARDMLSSWSELWELNPRLLGSVLRFLDVAWKHGEEHKAVLLALRDDPDFWKHLAAISAADRGPLPESTKAESYVTLDGRRLSSLHEPVFDYAYRTLAKAYALHTIALDVGMHLLAHGAEERVPKSASFTAIHSYIKSENSFSDLIMDAASNPYDPELYDAIVHRIHNDYSALSLEQLRLQDHIDEREFGDEFTFSIALLNIRLPSRVAEEDSMDEDSGDLERHVRMLNLNLSLTYAQTELSESCQFFLRQATPFLRPETGLRPQVFKYAAVVSSAIAKETRSGDMMATIHGTQLSLLLSLLEIAWFSTSDSEAEKNSFFDIVENVHGIVMNEAQPPSKSFLGTLTTSFHRFLLQILYYCARHYRSLARRPKVLHAKDRIQMSTLLESSLALVIGALRFVFDSARTRVDLELDRDMELLVSVFEHCTRPDINSSSTYWLARIQETDVVRSSLDLLARVDLVGISDLALLRAQRRTLYGPHILLFHVALASIPSAAERLASDGVLAAYSNNVLSPAIRAGMIDTILPEFQGERSPAHAAYCLMLGIVAGVITSVGRVHHFFDSEISGFVQLYGDQISRALSWTVNDPLTFALLEEIEQSVNLFYAIANSTPPASKNNQAINKVLRVFTSHALLLLQQVNYALTHPNQLASTFEPITSEERAQLEKEPRGSTSASFDPMARPLLTRLVYRMLKLASAILSTLIIISKADTVLLGEKEDWPLQEALVVPHSKVVVGEPASVGTLIELGNCSLDILREVANRPGGQAITPASALIGKDDILDVRQGAAVAHKTLETAAVYAVTQLVMWLAKPESASPNSASEMDMDDPSPSDSQRGDMSKHHSSISERDRRRMVGERASDLQGLLVKAKPLVAKSVAKDLDITQILSDFLKSRVSHVGDWSM